MAGKLVQEYRERTPVVYIPRTPEELFDEYREKARMGAVMHENSMRFLLMFTGYRPKSEVEPNSGESL